MCVCGWDFDDGSKSIIIPPLCFVFCSQLSTSPFTSETLDVVDLVTKAHYTVQEFRKETFYCEKKPMKH